MNTAIAITLVWAFVGSVFWLGRVVERWSNQ